MSRCRLRGCPIQRFEFNVFEPAIAAVILQANVTGVRMRLGYAADISVFASVKPLAGLRPFIEIDSADILAIEIDGNNTAIASDDNMVPLADRFHGVTLGLDQIVKSTG